MRVFLHGDRTALETLLNMAVLYLESFLPIEHGMAHLQQAGGTLVSSAILSARGKGKTGVCVWGGVLSHAMCAPPSVNMFSHYKCGFYMNDISSPVPWGRGIIPATHMP